MQRLTGADGGQHPSPASLKALFQSIAISRQDFGFKKAMQDLCNSIEAAIKDRIESAEIPINVYTGQGDYEKEHPSLVVHAQTGSESPQGSGNFTITVACEIRYAADSEQLQTHRTLANQALGELMVSNLATVLSDNATGLTVFGVLNRQVQSGIDENHWLTALTFDLYCCILDITT